LGFVHYSQKVGAPTKSTHIYAPRYLNDDTKSEVHSTPYLLQGAKSEAETISQLFPSKLFNDETLNKSQFIKTADKAKILHLAMHAEVNNDYSELSRLLFSNNLNKEEDHLYLEELYGLSLGADLAILSACNTGTGFERNGSLESFQRAFTFAGVPATVASLWEVPDASTKDIMVYFYKNLQDGQSKSEALRNAKLSYRDQHSGTKLSAPYFWAGFVVYGSDTQVVESSSKYLLYAFSACIPLFILIVYRKKKRTS
jgi:CHAT domain-containing protein